MFSSLRLRLLALCVLTMAIAVALAAAAIPVRDRFVADLSATRMIGIALRNHTFADMVHDGLRGDVHAALLAAETGAPRSQVEGDFAARAETFRRAVAANGALALPPDAAEAVAAVAAPLQAHAEAAEQLIALAYADRARALAALPDFERRSRMLAGAMKLAGDRLQVAAAAIEGEAARFGRLAGMVAWFGLSVVAICFLALVAFALFGLMRPLARIEETMLELAEDRTDVAVPFTGRNDEIGRMAAAIEIFKASTADRIRLEREREEEKGRAAARSRAETLRFADHFEREVGVIVGSVSEAARQLEAAARTLTASSEATSSRLAAVAAASEQASANVRSVAAATEELSSSVWEITQQVVSSSTMATSAAAEAVETSAKVKHLTEAARKIGNILGLIQDIAEQTNLLALNATIEAARAGEAGRGFAVVAAEVKNLATQTARATTEIGQHIAAIQTSTRDSADAIGSVTEAIQELNAIATAIAAAVEEQGATTNGIARNVQDVSLGTTEVSSNIAAVTDAASEANAAAHRVLSFATDLSGHSERLRDQAARFLDSVRAA
jgi:methyl-accepting chemotaxis protein